MKATDVARERSRPRGYAATAAVLGGVLLSSLFMAPAQASSDLADGVNSTEILVPSAFDARLADDGVTPIAVDGGTNAAGEQIVYGARASTTPPIADLGASIIGTRYFVDCGNGTGTAGAGTQASPFRSLGEVNAVALVAGDQVLFRRGSVCEGMFEPQGSGSVDADVVVDAYGDAASAMPRIDAAGATQAVFLNNVQHYTVRNLELTNHTDDDRDYATGSKRRGITVAIEDIGVGAGYTLTDLYIHDVLGENKKDRVGSAGIEFDVNGTAVPTKFSDVELANNTIRHVNRSGINMGSTWWGRAEAEPGSPENRLGWDPFFIHDNFVTDIGGDGIVVQYASGSKVEHNTVENVANGHDGKSVNGVNAAVWPWNADRVEFRFNHVFGTVKLPDNNDGVAFNADTGNTGGIYEQNLSHDNEGGFMMFCGCWGLSTNATVRYNISLNDGREVPNLNKTTGVTSMAAARTIFMAGQTDGQLYNNTFLLPSTPVDIAHPDNYLADNVVMANNVFFAQANTVVSETATAVPFSTINWRNNVFAGAADGWPTANTASNQTLPQLGLATGTGLARLKVTDPALAAAGATIADEGQVDVVGNPVPWVTAPDVGAYQFSSVASAAQRTVYDGGFELASDASNWTLAGAAKRVTTGARSGAGALAISASSDSATVGIKAAVNRTYRLVAAVKADDVDHLPQVLVTLPSGDTVEAQAVAGAASDSSGYTAVSAVFRTAYDASNFTVTIAGNGAAGLVDDVTVEAVEDLMVDGAFEAAKNTVWQAVNNNTGNFARSTDSVTGKLAAPFTPQLAASNRFTYVTPETDYELGVWAKAHDSSDGTVTLSWVNAGGQSAAATSTAPKYTRISVPLNSRESKLTVSCSGWGTCDDMTLVPVWAGPVAAVSAPTTPAPSPEEGGNPTDPSDPTNGLVTVLATHSNPKAVGTYQLGDQLVFSHVVTNVAKTTVAVIPIGDLQNFDPTTAAKNCRYQSLAADASYTCAFAYHVVTAEDLKTGSYTPATSWEVRDGGITGPVLGVVADNTPTVQLSVPATETPAATASASASVSASASATASASASATATTPATTPATTAPTATASATTLPTVTTEPAATNTPSASVSATAVPSSVATAVPTVESTAKPTVIPTVAPTVVPTAKPTVAPTVVATTDPAAEPTGSASAEPTSVTTGVPVATSTATVSSAPVASATAISTATGTAAPTATPTTAATSTSAASSTVAPTLAPGETGVVLSAQTIVAGGSLTVTGAGYAAGEDVRLELHSTPVVLDTVKTDAEGAFTAKVTIPASTVAGDHQIVAVGVDSARQFSTPLTVAGVAAVDSLVSGEGALAFTGMPTTLVLLLAAGLVVAGSLGVAGVMLRTKRRHA